MEQYTRQFNYPEKSRVKWLADLPELGIKTYFCSNVCAMYRRELYLQLGGFVQKAIFNEDMIFAGELIQKGYGVAYAAEAKVVHSHNYSAIQQFHRNFDLAVSQADHPEVFAGIRSEGEGIRLVKKTAGWLCRQGKPWLVIQLVWQSGWKYLGYLLGKRYQKLPKWVIPRCTMNPKYWE
ncbi:MAG: glycosyltransferase family 2 protein [Lachnospiraceae bacterium]